MKDLQKASVHELNNEFIKITLVKSQKGVEGLLMNLPGLGQNLCLINQKCIVLLKGCWKIIN
jgi:hypothetical protein